MSTILVVEDDTAIAQTIDYALRRAGFTTLVSGDGRAALELARTTHPDLIVLDIMLPGMDGFAFAEELRRTNQDTAIVMMTALDQPADVIRGLDGGADDYITKPFAIEELLARVRANLRRVRERTALHSEEIIEAGDLRIEPAQFVASVAGAPVKLRLKEFQLLLALAGNPGQLMTRQKLAGEVWGYEFLPSSRTIDVHIRRVRQAVEERSAYTYITTIHGLGYRFEPRVKDSGGSTDADAANPSEPSTGMSS